MAELDHPTRFHTTAIRNASIAANLTAAGPDRDDRGGAGSRRFSRVAPCSLVRTSEHSVSPGCCGSIRPVPLRTARVGGGGRSRNRLNSASDPTAGGREDGWRCWQGGNRNGSRQPSRVALDAHPASLTTSVTHNSVHCTWADDGRSSSDCAGVVAVLCAFTHTATRLPAQRVEAHRHASSLADRRRGSGGTVDPNRARCATCLAEGN